MKIIEDLKLAKNPSIIKIANHLIAKAENDQLITKTLNKPNKSLDEMFKYVSSEAKKKAQNGVACIEDDEVYGWAQHYYDEDSIVLSKKVEPKQKKKEEKISLPDNDLPDNDLSSFDF